jgi:hypothetical protein
MFFKMSLRCFKFGTNFGTNAEAFLIPNMPPSEHCMSFSHGWNLYEGLLNSKYVSIVRVAQSPMFHKMRKVHYPLQHVRHAYQVLDAAVQVEAADESCIKVLSLLSNLLNAIIPINTTDACVQHWFNTTQN